MLIARALAGTPDLLVLDEPTAGVDVQSQQAFADALSTLVARGATIVLVAHELGPLGPLVDRAVVMRDGRVAYDGPPIDAFTDADPCTTTSTTTSPASARPATRCPWPHRWTGPGRTLMSLLTYDFMIRALLGALFTGLAAPAVGTYLVQRRLALMGDGIGHIAVTGVALGLLTGTSPTLTAVIVAVVGAVVIESIRDVAAAPAATSRWRCCSTAASPAAC